MQYWWVNQNQTYRHEVHGGYLWSPKTTKNGARNRFYDAMTEVSPGDLVFSFADTFIKAIGIVSGPHESASKPTEFGKAGANWTTDGWFVPVTFEELKHKIRPRDHINTLEAVLPAKYSPLQSSGDGNQGVYLAPVPQLMAEKLIELLQGQVETILTKASSMSDATDNLAISEIVSDPDMTTTQRTQLIQARIGQGLFRSRVAEIEPKCRVTGLDNSKFLIASHIKPWARSNNQEKLDGFNGLLLAPHIDHLFDKGYITFEDDGALLLSPQLPPVVAGSWAVGAPAVMTPLTTEQSEYMIYHRAHVFRS